MPGVTKTVENTKKSALESYLKTNFIFINDEISNKIWCKKKNTNENLKEFHPPTILDYARDYAVYKSAQGFSTTYTEKFVTETVSSEKFCPPVNPLKEYFLTLPKINDVNGPFICLANYIILEDEYKKKSSYSLLKNGL